MEKQREYNFIFWNSSIHKRKHNITVPAAPVSIIRQPEVLVLFFFFCVPEHMFSLRLRKDIGILKANMRINVFRFHCRDRPNRTVQPIGWIPCDSTPLQHGTTQVSSFSVQKCVLHIGHDLFGHATWNRRRILVHGLQLNVTNTCPFYITHHITCRYKGPSTRRTSPGGRPLGF